MTDTKKTASEIRAIRAANPKMREHDLSRVHGIGEAELVAAHCGEGAVRLRVDLRALLDGLTTLGEVMALTRNESAVHEKIGPYENAKFNAHASIVLGEQIDLRIFPGRWRSGFAVEKPGDDGAVRRSLQFFDAHGDAVHKVHARPETDLVAWDALVESLRSDDQSQQVELAEKQPAKTTEPAASADELRRRWSQMTDTHQLFPMLRKLNLDRRTALTMVGDDYAWRLASDAVPTLFRTAADSQLPIMAFVGNDGCIQIHSGPVHDISLLGPWLNVLDPTFHLHLRLDHIAEVWAIRKPVGTGHVSSVEAYDVAGKLIIQFFGKRQEGVDERPDWRLLVESLPVVERIHAA